MSFRCIRVNARGLIRYTITRIKVMEEEGLGEVVAVIAVAAEVLGGGVVTFESIVAFLHI